MQAAHEKSVEASLSLSESFQTLFDRLGHSDAPDGKVLAAYRAARRALSDAQHPVDNPSARDIRDALETLRGAVEREARRDLEQAVKAGTQQAETALRAYDLPLTDSETDTGAALGAIDTRLAAQLDASYALLETYDVGAELVIGDGDRAGLLTPGPLLSEITRWIVIVGLAAFDASVSASAQKAGNAAQFRRQAVAAIDHKTTDCCLRVHGQIVGMDEPFRLTGFPRFADRMMHAPFHYWCRTTEALVRGEDTSDSLTAAMTGAAGRELGARGPKGDNRVYIHPANALSGRGVVE